MRHIARVIGVVASAALLFTGTAGAADAGADRPLQGTIVGEATFPLVDTDICAVGRQTQSTGTGTFSHLGRTSMYSEHCTPPGAEITGGVMTLTAASGDAVYLAYSATQLDLPDVFGGTVPLGGTIPIEGEFEVTGGTGRFDDATGAGTFVAGVIFEGLGDPAWAATWTYAGTIDY